MNEQQAVVLGGGGASGAYTVGVLQALFRGESPSTHHQPIDPAIFSGTSIGSFIASFLISRRATESWDAALDALEALWLQEISAYSGYNGAFRMRLNPVELFHPANLRRGPLWSLRRIIGDIRALGRHGVQRVQRMLRGDKPVPERLMELMDGHIFLDLERWDQILRRSINFSNLRESDRVLRMTATRWQEGTLQIFDNQDMDDEDGPRAIRASCTVPGFFSPTRVGEAYYIDGSMRLYAPVSPAVSAGGREIHLAYMNVNVDTAPVDGFENSMEALFRALVIYWLADVEREVARVRAYNQALALLNGRCADEDADPDLMAFLEGAETVHGGDFRPEIHQPITLHRYFPRSTPYDGTLSFTSVHRSRMESLIALGIEETRAHDCERCGCVLP